MTTERPACAARADLRRARAMLVIVIVGLAASGATAVPLRWGADVLVGLAGPGSALQPLWPAMAEWLGRIRDALAAADPLLFYGTDWLAFAHIVIALAFIGPLRDPLRNVWVIEWGMLACTLIPPTAFIFGPLRGIPFFWQLIDCSFGVLGFLPLYLAWRAVRRAERALAA